MTEPHTFNLIEGRWYCTDEQCDANACSDDERCSEGCVCNDKCLFCGEVLSLETIEGKTAWVDWTEGDACEGDYEGYNENGVHIHESEGE